MEIKLENLIYFIDEQANSIAVRFPGGIKSMSLNGLTQEQIQIEFKKWIEDEKL